MNLSNHHHQQHTSSSIHYWIRADSHRMFIDHIKDHQRKQQLEKYGFLDDNHVVSYQFNQDGFRCKNFDDSDSIIALGCSFTMGVGLHAENTWPSVIEQQLKLTVWNLGISGASMDTCFRMLNYYISKLNAKCVLVLGPPNQRFELHTDSGVECFMPSQIMPSENAHPVEQYWYQNEINGELNYYKNCLAIQQLCQQHGKKCVIGYSLELLAKKDPSDQWPGARDMMHAGAREQQSCAGYFLKAI